MMNLSPHSMWQPPLYWFPNKPGWVFFFFWPVSFFGLLEGSKCCGISVGGATSSIKRRKGATHTHAQTNARCWLSLSFKYPVEQVRRPPFKLDDGIHLTKRMKRIIIKNKKEPRKKKEINPLEGWNVLVCVSITSARCFRARRSFFLLYI